MWPRLSQVPPLRLLEVALGEDTPPLAARAAGLGTGWGAAPVSALEKGPACAH